MAIEAYAIGVNLVTKVNMGPLSDLLKALENVNKAVRDTQTGINEMVSGIRGAARVAAGLADTMDKVARSAAAAGRSMRGAGAGGGGGSPRAPGPRASAAAPLMLGWDGNRSLVPSGGRDVAFGDSGAPPPLGGIPLNYRGPRTPEKITPHDLTMAGVGSLAVGGAAAGFTVQAFDAAREVYQERSKMALAGFSGDQIARAVAQAQSTQQNVPGSSLVGNLEIIRDFAGLIQNPDEAIGAVSGFAKMGQVLSTVGKGGEMAELFSAMQAGELRGALSNQETHQIDPAKFSQFLQNLESVTIATNGRVGPTDYVNFLRQAGVAGVRMDDKTLFQDMPTVMLAMRAMRTGTAASSFYQTQFGRLAKPYGIEQERVGLIDAGGYVGTGGGGGYVKHGAMPGAELAQSDLVGYIQQILLPKLSAAGFKDQNSQLTELYKLFPRSTITRLMEDIIRNMPLVDAYSKSIGNKMQGPNPYDILSNNNPDQAVKAFNAALSAFLATLADPSMGAATGLLKDLTSALNAMSNWAKANPGTARVILDVAAGLAAIGTVAGFVLLAVAPAMAIMKIAKSFPGGIPTMPGGGPAAAPGMMSQLPGLGMLYGVSSAVKGGIDMADDAVLKHLFGWTDDDFKLRDQLRAAGPFGSVAPGPRTGSAPGSSGPVPVIVTNGHDLVNGVGNGLANQSSLPPAGPSSVGPRDMPAYPGFMPFGGP